MIEAAARYVGGKTLGALLTVASILVIIWYWRQAPEDRDALWAMVRGTLIWLGFVAVFPWALFFVPARVARAESNLVSAALLAGYLAVEVVFALYLTGGRTGNTWQKAALILGFLCAAVYNFVVCEFLAGRSEDAA